MRVRGSVFFAIWLAVGLAGCFKGSGVSLDVGGPSDPDGGPERDGPPPDGVAAPGINVGAPCTPNAAARDCKSQSPLCIRNQCTAECVPDDPITPSDEDTCPEAKSGKTICGMVPGFPDQAYCLVRCVPSETANPCPQGSGTACNPSSTEQTARLDVAACVLAACRSDKDCPVVTERACDPKSGDADCEAVAGEFCLTVGEGSHCAVPGHCNTTTGLCGANYVGTPGVKVGAPCAKDADCDKDQFCEREYADAARGTMLRNGYCTKRGCTFAQQAPSFACPAGSVCLRGIPGGHCRKACSLGDAASCRGVGADKLGDYECYAWDRVKHGGLALADGPVCDFAGEMGCDQLPLHGLKECKELGDATNSTKMSCRDPATNKELADKLSKAGRCLDDTASGPP
ncbi:MAG: hypothetical protein IT371_12955 [Deltaproteobacteria bacterium]|nr:hypothetical protein [Deltaproteobacteria bacterium]